MAKFVQGNALVVFDIMLKQAKQYDNMIESLVNSLASCDQLSLDICAYTIIRFASDSKDVALDNEANIE